MAGLLFFLAFLPAASSAIVQLYHPQDIVSLGLALAGMAQALRKRWILAGALLGLAVLNKQYALLLVLPTIVVAPSKVPRLQVALAALVVLAAGIVPFLLAAPQATLENFSGFSAGGAVSGATLLSISGVKGDVASAVARDAPVLFAAAVCAVALIRRGDWLARPQALVAIGLACISGRLVFESVIFAYYLLAPSVLFLMLDLVARRSAYRSLAWCAGAAFFVAIHPGNTAVDAVRHIRIRRPRGRRRDHRDAPLVGAGRDHQVGSGHGARTGLTGRRWRPGRAGAAVRARRRPRRRRRCLSGRAASPAPGRRRRWPATWPRPWP